MINHFRVPEQYRVEALVGQGAYGAVCKGRRNDGTAEGSVVAIKKIPHYNKSEDNCTKVLRELQIIRYFQPVQQIVACHDAFRVQEGDGQKDVYIVMDYFDSDLSTAIKSKVITTEPVIRFMVSQLLLGLRALHRHNCIHRDLSSRNILVDSSTARVFLCDFGLARFYDPEERMSYGVVTQWYRAPEIVTDAKYDAKVDIWAVGVILAELFLQSHLFPGRPNDLADQLKRILLTIGAPEPAWFGIGSSSNVAAAAQAPFATASVNAKRYIESYLRHAGGQAEPAASTTFVNRLPFAVAPSDGAKAFITRLLSFNPATRPTADQALSDVWLRDSDVAQYIADEIACQDRDMPAFEPSQFSTPTGGLPPLVEATDAFIDRLHQEMTAA